MYGIEKSPQVANNFAKYREFAFQVAIGAHATPASKTHNVDVPDSVTLRTEGKTAAADAIKDMSAYFSTAADSTGIFGVLVNGANLSPHGILRIVSLELRPSVGTIAEGTNKVTLSSDDFIAIDLDSNQNLASQSLTVEIVLGVMLDI